MGSGLEATREGDDGQRGGTRIWPTNRPPRLARGEFRRRRAAAYGGAPGALAGHRCSVGNGLVRITVLHGTVVDVDYPPVRRSKFEHLDQRLLPRRARATDSDGAQPPEHELKLTWLEAVAGGLGPSLSLDDSPLVPEAEPDLRSAAQLAGPHAVGADPGPDR